MAVGYKRGNAFNNFFGTNAERIALTNMETADTFKTSDTLKKYVYTGSAWMLDEDEITLNTDDIEIGAVEIKDGASDQRATVSVAGAVKVEIDNSTILSNTPSALAASGVLKGTGGTLYTLSGLNNSLSDQYIQIHITGTVPNDGAAPFAVFVVPAKGNFSFDFGIYGLPCSAGIVWNNSSTLATKTIGSADCYVIATYK